MTVNQINDGPFSGVRILELADEKLSLIHI